MTTTKFKPGMVAKLAGGEIAVKFDRKTDNLEVLRELLKCAFPKDLGRTGGSYEYYFAMPCPVKSGEWYPSSDSKGKSYFRLAEFIEEVWEPKNGEEVEVSDNNKDWTKKVGNYISIQP